MKAKLLLRIAAVLMLLHAIGHTMGALGWKKAPNNSIAQVISGMQNNHFNFMGSSCSIAGFYEGYGLSMILVLLFVSILLWLLSASLVKPLLMLTGLFLVGLAAVEFIYFFPFAAAFSLAAGLGTLTALKRDKESTRSGAS